jgi:hypothetical protein
VINVKVLEVVIEIDRAGAKISTEECSVSGENGGNVDMTFPAEGYGKTRLPFVKMSNDSFVKLSGHELGSRD